MQFAVVHILLYQAIRKQGTKVSVSTKEPNQVESLSYSRSLVNDDAHENVQLWLGIREL